MSPFFVDPNKRELSHDHVAEQQTTGPEKHRARLPGRGNSGPLVCTSENLHPQYVPMS